MKTKTKRFSKAEVARYCARNIDMLTATFKFEPYGENGTNQLRGRRMEDCVAYGMRDALADLMDHFDLRSPYDAE